MFFIRHALVLIYTILFALLICGLCMNLFQSPLVTLSNVEGSVIYAATVNYVISIDVPGLDIPVPGANISFQATIDLWSVSIEVEVDVSHYNFAPQHVYQRYNAEDLPCKEFANTMRTAQVFGVLSVFTSFFCLVLIVSNFFSRLFLPVLWVMTWVNVACVSGVTCMLLRMLCEPSCYDTSSAVPSFSSLAVPDGGFAMYMICMVTYLITSILSVFL